MKTIYFVLYPEGGEISERMPQTSFRVFILPEIARPFLEKSAAEGFVGDDGMFHYRKGFTKTLEIMEKRHSNLFYDDWNYSPHTAPEYVKSGIESLLVQHGLSSVLNGLYQVLIERSSRADTDSKAEHGRSIARTLIDVMEERMKMGVTVA